MTYLGAKMVVYSFVLPVKEMIKRVTLTLIYFRNKKNVDHIF